jgi:hypothetical protein
MNARREPMKRGKRLRARSERNSYRRRPRDLPYLRWLKTRSCIVGHAFGDPCAGVVEAAHREVGGRAMGQKTPDGDALPICVRHHREPGMSRVPGWVAMDKPARASWWAGWVIEFRAGFAGAAGGAS